uniref:Anthranilate synthase component 2 n=1 Tax=Dipterocladia arabiensis TaxID=2007176 RepID=A0A1Z1M0N7_9FLOR|nr:Anthranilate synthase component II [Dipterocladia arabiensis]ARW59313.1 Anthranilate synthase component II [Dipterocladia arabiensis]
MIIIIDNYDSFTQNLLQYVGELKFNVKIIRNDEISLKTLIELSPTHIILSPGPGNPSNSGICLEILENYANKIPILGVCLGHQSIGYIYGATIKPLDIPSHGKISNIFHNNTDLFNNLPNPFTATRYHSLVIDEKIIPNNLKVTAWTQQGIIMGCQHRIHTNIQGVQFHPESLWTQEGKKIIQNFLLL